MRKLLLGAGLVVVVILGWRSLIERVGRPLTELDELYPPPRDDYLDRLLGLSAVRETMIRSFPE